MIKHVSLSEFLSYQKPEFFLDAGTEGCCYLLDNNKVLKVYYLTCEERKIYFDDYQNSQIAFPIEIFVINNRNLIGGYTCNYLLGNKFIEGFNDNLDIEKLRQAYLKMRLIMLKLKNVYMFDNVLGNMLYDYDHNMINLIDTGGWYPKLDGHMDRINEFNRQMVKALLYGINRKHYVICDNKELNELYNMYTKEENIPSLFLDYLNKILSEYKGFKVKKIKDLRI